MKEVARRTEQRQGYWLPNQSGLESAFYPSPGVALSKSPPFSEVLFHHLQNGGIISIWCWYKDREGPHACWVMGECPLPLLWATAQGHAGTSPLYGHAVELLTHHLPDYPTLAFLFVDSATLEQFTTLRS